MLVVYSVNSLSVTKCRVVVAEVLLFSYLLYLSSNFIFKINQYKVNVLPKDTRA